METHLGPVYAFGDFKLDPKRELLYSLRSGEALSLTPKAFGTLHLLVRHAGQVVEKTALLEAVWPGVIVEEANLTQTVHVLRRVLGEHPYEHRYIVTVPGRGYRFVADVRELEQPGGTEKDRSSGPQPASGMTGARYLPRVGAAALALGIIAVPFVGIQEHRQLAPEAVAVPTSDRATTAQAYQEYLRGNLLLGRRGSGDLERAADAYRRALQSDPHYARAWAGLASAAYLQTVEESVPRELTLATLGNAARRAIALDPELPEAHLRLASYYKLTGRYGLAHQHFDKAANLNPDSPLILGGLAGHAAESGRFDRAIELQRRVVSIEPLSAVNLGNLATYLFFDGQLDAAKSEYLKALELRPNARDTGMVGVILILQRDLETALEFIERSAASEEREQGLALLYYALGRTAEADAALARLTAACEGSDPFLIAEVYGFRANAVESFKWLDRAKRDAGRQSPHWARRQLWEMRASPLLVSLHDDPRWPGWAATREELDRPL